MEPKIIHLVVRFSDNMFSVGDVVTKHNDLVDHYGAVWFGKMGGTLSLSRIALFNNQISRGIPTFVYLVKGNRRKSTPFKAKLLEITRDFPEKEKALIPAYYTEKELLKLMKAWIKMGQITRVDISSLKNLKTINSVIPLEETLALSASGYFLVYESKFIF